MIKINRKRIMALVMILIVTSLLVIGCTSENPEEKTEQKQEATALDALEGNKKPETDTSEEDIDENGEEEEESTIAKLNKQTLLDMYNITEDEPMRQFFNEEGDDVIDGLPTNMMIDFENRWTVEFYNLIIGRNEFNPYWDEVSHKVSLDVVITNLGEEPRNFISGYNSESDDFTDRDGHDFKLIATDGGWGGMRVYPIMSADTEDNIFRDPLDKIYEPNQPRKGKIEFDIPEGEIETIDGTFIKWDYDGRIVSEGLLSDMLIDLGY